MDELSKIRRIVDKKAPNAKVEFIGFRRHPKMDYGKRLFSGGPVERRRFNKARWHRQVASP